MNYTLWSTVFFPCLASNRWHIVGHKQYMHPVLVRRKGSDSESELLQAWEYGVWIASWQTWQGFWLRYAAPWTASFSPCQLFLWVDLSPPSSPAVGQNKGGTPAANADRRRFLLKGTRTDTVLVLNQLCLVDGHRAAISQLLHTL